MNISATPMEQRDGGGDFGVFLVPPPRVQRPHGHPEYSRSSSQLPHHFYPQPRLRSGLAPPQNLSVQNTLVEPTHPHPNMAYMSAPVTSQGTSLYQSKLTGTSGKRGIGKRQYNKGGQKSRGDARGKRSESTAVGEKLISKNSGKKKLVAGGTQGWRAEIGRNGIRQSGKVSKKRGERSWEMPQLQDLRGKQAKTRNKSLARALLDRPGTIPHAPRNTSSYIMRASRLGINATSTASPATPAILPSPSISSDVWEAEAAGERQFAEEAKAVKVLDFYGTMNSYIRLRTPDPHAPAAPSRGVHEGMIRGSEGGESLGEDADAGLPASGVEQLERRMDQDLLRFEMLYLDQDGDASLAGPSHADEGEQPLAHPRTADEKDILIAKLEKDNQAMKAIVDAMRTELDELRQQTAGRAHQEAVKSGDIGDEVSHALQ